MSVARFKDGGTYLGQFLTQVSVVCPKCGGHALAGKSRVVCAACGYSESRSATAWKGPTEGSVRRRCAYCGRWLEKRIAGPRHTFLTRLTCSGCGCKMDEKIVWRATVHRTPHDPYFGLPLWFVGTVKGQVVWAYNREHLAFLLALVGANLRQREPNRNSSMISRLPSWLLAKKNRAAAISALRRMQGRS